MIIVKVHFQIFSGYIFDEMGEFSLSLSKENN